jgi:hypothetical protein
MNDEIYLMFENHSDFKQVSDLMSFLFDFYDG